MRMKQRQEIKEMIDRLRLSLHKYPSVPSRQQNGYKEITKGQIKALKWVLGHKITPSYFCTYCQRVHIGLQCPSCGGTKHPEPFEQ